MSGGGDGKHPSPQGITMVYQTGNNLHAFIRTNDYGFAFFRYSNKYGLKFDIRCTNVSIFIQKVII